MNCPSCGEPAYESGHAHEDCPGDGLGCQECGWGCDLDFTDDGQCAELEAAAARIAENGADHVR